MIKIQTHKLKKAMSLSSAVSGSRHVKEILENCLIEYGDGKLKVSATDTEIWSTTVLECECNGQGSFLTPIKKMASTCDACGEDITIRETDKGIIVESGRSKFQFPTPNRNEFPFVSLQGEEIAKISSDHLKYAIECTEKVFDESNVKFALGGVMFIGESGST